ncbi:beta-glucosidase family protein [Amycolatopsis sp. lyj-112]|uniref:beta-glucosidase family protein n=1 Tax=Amycolatopsis sp. lyj-112 TaxID=2789288 RepID=UPI00397D482B
MVGHRGLLVSGGHDDRYGRTRPRREGPAADRVRGAEFAGGRVTSLLPNATLIAQHWDPAVAGRVGALLAEEAGAQEVHVVLGPAINLHRSPLGGRLFEAFSEDPLLTGVLATAYVRGLQDNGIGATPKHYLANESETDRTTVDSVVDEKTLREVYLLPFEMVVADAEPWAIMASYNKINGVTATEHAELIDGVLKGEWGYDGLVISDWFATKSTAASANGGLDLVMPGPVGPWGKALAEAVRAGEVAESTVDDHLDRLLRLAERVGALRTEALGAERSWPSGIPAPDSAERRDTLRELAAGGMTVLVNKNDTLPLAGTGTVALIGRHATETIAQGGGSAGVRPPHIVSIADGLSEALGDRLRVADGVEVRNIPVAPALGSVLDPETGEPGMRAIALDGDGNVLESRHFGVAETVIVDGGWLHEATSVRLSAQVVLDEPSRLQIGVRGLGVWAFEVGEDKTDVRIEGSGSPHEGLLSPPAWTTERDVEPGTTITATLVEKLDRTIFGLVVRAAPLAPAEAISKAAHAAEQADVAVVVVGLTQEREAEGYDKSTLTLPGEQDALVAAVAAAAQRTVVVVNAATPVLMPWLSQVDAVLWAGLPGQEAGAAVASALLGEVEPAGRLVTTFPARDGDGPVWSVTPVDGALPYAEGTAVGYRGWESEPLFWFGHGLGYTTWEYGESSLTAEDDVVRTVSVDVTNTGARQGREVVQVYLRPGEPGEPVRLIGWAGISLAPGETGRVEVTCDPRVQRVWDRKSWRPLSGEGTVVIARGLGDVRATLLGKGPRQEV